MPKHSPPPDSHLQIAELSEVIEVLNDIMDKVCDDHEPMVITRPEGDPVVLISLADFSEMMASLSALDMSLDRGQAGK